MATIVTLQSSDLISNSRADLNTNFSNLNSDKIETSVLDTDTSLAAASDSKIATQKATKGYVDSKIGLTQFSTTQVFNTNPPTTWTDLDLSSVIGVKQRMVVLMITTGGTSSDFAVRTNGQTNNFIITSISSSLNVVHNGADGTTAATVLVKTDINGVIEWICNSAADTTVVTVEAYW